MTTTENTPAAEPVLTVTWDTVIGARHIGHDPDTGPEVEPVSLGEMVVHEIAVRLTEEVKRYSRDDYRDAISIARDAAREAAQEQARQMVADALSGEITRTNHWGEKQGETKTLRDLIREDVQAFLSEPLKARDGFGSDRERKGGFRELVREETTAVLRKELQEEITAARAQVAQVVRDNAAALIGDAVKGATR